MDVNQIATSGTYPSITWDPTIGKVRVAWQSGALIIRTALDPLTLVEDVAHTTATLNIGGAAAHPEIYTWNGQTYHAYRDGGEPYFGRIGLLGGEKMSLGQVHGSRPIVFGEGLVAYIAGGSGEGYPVRIQPVGQRAPGPVVRHAEGTGLSRIVNGQVIIVNEDRAAVPGIGDPSWAGDAVVGTTDLNGKPTLLAFRGSKRCYIATGQVSKDPRMCTDGHSLFMTAWGDQGEGIRVWRVDPEDFTTEVPKPTYFRTPAELPAYNLPKYAGFYYSNGKYGEFDVKENATVLAWELFANDDNGTPVWPADAEARFVAVAQKVPRLFVNGSRETLTRVRPFWDKVAAVFHHEVGDAVTTLLETAKVRALVKEMGLFERPVMSTLTEWDCVDASFDNTADIAGCEIYFERPAINLVEMEKQTQTMIDTVLRCQRGKVLLIPQNYDRPPYDKPIGAAWRGQGAMLEAINFVCARAMAQHDRIVGLLWFSYARMGGALEFPQLRPWHDAIVDRLSVPAKLPIKKEEKPMFFPSDEQNTNALQRIALSYVNDLKRAEGIFGVPPDGLSVAITRPDGGARIDTKSIAVWLGRYFRKFNDFKGDHEQAIRWVEDALRNSDEAKAHRPQ